MMQGRIFISYLGDANTFFYHPCSKASEGYVFTGMCHSFYVMNGGGGGVCLFPKCITGHMIILAGGVCPRGWGVFPLGGGVCPPGKADPPKKADHQEGWPPQEDRPTRKADPPPRKAEPPEGRLSPPPPGIRSMGACTHPNGMHTCKLWFLKSTRFFLKNERLVVSLAVKLMIRICMRLDAKVKSSRAICQMRSTKQVNIPQYDSQLLTM